MHKSNVTLLVYIKGERPAIEYTSPRDLQTYIEGRDGSEFEIEVVNDNPFQIEAVVSVDGLSVLDGKAAGNSSGGYLVEARSRLRIPGWKVDSGKAAKFTFSGRKDGSYVEQSTGQATNKGVIGLKVFEEAGRNRVTHNPFVVQNNFGAVPLGGGAQWSGVYGSAAPSDSSSIVDGSITTRSLSRMSKGGGETMKSASRSRSLSASSAVEQTLGTGFGEATEFRTTKVEFTRGDMLALIALYYDDKRGLAKRGIEIVRPSETRYATRPNPFPDDEGCAPPPGWNG